MTFNVAAGGAGAVQSVTYPITRTQLLQADSHPIEILPAQGAGKIIIPLSLVVAYSPGEDLFTQDNLSAALIYTGGTGSLVVVDSQDTAGNSPFKGGNLQVAVGTQEDFAVNSEGINTGLSFRMSASPVATTGPIVSATVNEAQGANPPAIPGDTFVITGGGDGTATGTVTTVSRAFPILSYDSETQTVTIAGNQVASFPGQLNAEFVFGSWYWSGDRFSPQPHHNTPPAAFADGVTTLIDDGGANNLDGTGFIISVNSGVTGVDIVDAGDGYAVANGIVASPDSPLGGQFTLDITAVDAPVPAASGTAMVTVTYIVLDAPA